MEKKTRKAKAREDRKVAHEPTDDAQFAEMAFSSAIAPEAA